MKSTDPLPRLARHLGMRRASVRRYFDQAALDAIEAHIREGELRHGAQVRFVIEASLSAAEIRARLSVRERALQVFSDLRIWDTEANNGVMLYLLLADHAVEIVADRAAARAVPDADWARICGELAGRYRAGQWLPGTLDALTAIQRLLAVRFPPAAGEADELPNRPEVI